MSYDSCRWTSDQNVITIEQIYSAFIAPNPQSGRMEDGKIISFPESSDTIVQNSA